MAKCSECGRRIWFRKICDDCESRIRFVQGAHAAAGGGATRSVVHGSFHHSSSTRIEIIVNGKSVQLSTSQALTPDLLQRLSAEHGIPLEHLAPLLEGALNGALPVATGAVTDLPAATPLRRIECPGCQRSVPARKDWCVYCGHQLTTSSSQGTAADEVTESVDDRFLEADPVVSEDAQASEQQMRNAYRQRLQDL